MRSFLNKNRIKAFVLTAVLITSNLTGCGRKPYDEPELVSPIAEIKMFKKPEYRDINMVKGLPGVVVPAEYPVFCKGNFTIDSLKVKIGDYVEEGDVIATGFNVSYGNSIEDYDRMISDESNRKGIQSSIDSTMISLEEYNRAEAIENGDQENVTAADKRIDLLYEDKRYNEEMSSREIRSYSEKREKLKAESADSVLVAPHSGYVTFIKDIAYSNIAMPYENVAIISDTSDLYVECRDMTVTQNMYKNFDEKYIYVNGEKKNLTEIEYSQEAVSLAEVQRKDVYTRYSVDADLCIGENVVLIFKQKMAENVMTVGTSAVTHSGINSFVYVRKGDSDDIEKRNIEIGSENGGYTEVKYGLNAEDEVYYPLDTFVPTNYVETEVGTKDITVSELSKFILGKNSNVTGYYTEHSGIMESIEVSTDTEVKKGDLLYTYNTDISKAKLAELEQNIRTLKKNHADTLAMYSEMKENPDNGPEDIPSPEAESGEPESKKPASEEPESKEPEPADTATMGDARTATPTDPEEPPKVYEPKFVEEKKNLNRTIIDYRIQLENMVYAASLGEMQKEYDNLSRNNNGSGLISVYADKDGIVKKIDRDSEPGKEVREGQYVLTIAEEGYNETLVQMRKMVTGAMGSANDDDGKTRSAELGTDIQITIGDKKGTGKAVGVNGHIKQNYLVESDGKVYLTYSVPGNDYRDQFYIDTDMEIDYDMALRDKKSVEITFDHLKYRGYPVLDSGVIYGEQLEDKTIPYVWVERDGELYKRYVTLYNVPDYTRGESIVIDGVEPGDKIIRESVGIVSEKNGED